MQDKATLNVFAQQDAPAETETPSPSFEAVGSAGSLINIRGTGFKTKGTLSLAGRTVETTAWYTRVDDGLTIIKAYVPIDITGGAVVVESGGQRFTGSFGVKPKA